MCFHRKKKCHKNVRNTITVFLDFLVALQILEIMGNPGDFVVQLLVMCLLMVCHIPSPTAVSFLCPQGRDTEKPGMCLNHGTVSHQKTKITTTTTKPFSP